MEKQDKTFGMLCHLTAFTMFIGVPFGNIIGPFIIWLIKKDESEFVDKCGKESLNFQISMTIYLFICGILALILIGFLGMVAVFLIELVCVIKASIKASEGEFYSYPMTIRFIK